MMQTVPNALKYLKELFKGKMMCKHKDEKLIDKYLCLERTIFELTAVFLEEEIKTPCLYPWFKVRRSVIGYFTSMEFAEKTLEASDESGASSEELTVISRGDVLFYYIRELPLGVRGDIGFEPEYRRRTYTRKKMLVSDGFALCMAQKDGNLGHEVYSDVVGRRFKVGDIVFWLRGDEAMIAIVSKSPYGESNDNLRSWDENEYEPIWNFGYEWCSPYESQYTILFGSGLDYHEHPSAIDLYPSPINVPVPIEKLLRRDLELVLESEKTVDLKKGY